MPQGNLKNWVKEKGYGFIGPDQGDSDIFAHARQLTGMDPNTLLDGRQPQGVRVTYELEWDEKKGRSKACSWSLLDGAGAGGGGGGGGCGMGGMQQNFGGPAPMQGGFPHQNFGGPQQFGNPMHQPMQHMQQQPMQGFHPQGCGSFGPQGGHQQQQQFGGGDFNRYQPYGGAQLGNPGGGGPAPLPFGWEQIPDPASGKHYFCNRSTGETRWDPPPGPAFAAPAPAPVAAAPAPQAAPSLPAGWEQMNDPSSGKTYYCNRSTGETSWDPPAAAAAPSHMPTAVAATPEPAPAKEMGSSLPAGWDQASDPASGKVYYINRATNETRWELPV